MFYARVLCSRFRLKNWAVHLFSSFEIRALRFSNYTSHDRHNCRPKKYFPRNAHVEIQIKALLLSVEFFTSFSLRPSRQSTQGLPTMCLIAYFAVFGVSPSLQISIKFFIVNDSNHSTVCWSFPWIWRLSFLDVSLGYYCLVIFLERILWIRLEIISYLTDNRTYAKIIMFQYFLGKQFCVRKSSSSLSMNTMKVWTDLLNNKTRR